MICYIEKNLDLKPALGEVRVTTTTPVDPASIKLPANRESVFAWTSKMTSKAYGLPGQIARRTSDIFNRRASRGGRGSGEDGEGRDGGGVEMVPMEVVGEGSESTSQRDSESIARGQEVDRSDSVPVAGTNVGGELDDVESPTSSSSATVDVDADHQLVTVSAPSPDDPEPVRGVPVVVEDQDGDISDFRIEDASEHSRGGGGGGSGGGGGAGGSSSGFLVVAAPHMPSMASEAVLTNTLEGGQRRPGGAPTRPSMASSDKTLSPKAGMLAGSSSTLLEVPRPSDDEIIVSPMTRRGGPTAETTTTTTLIGMDEAMAAEAADTQIDENGEPTQPTLKQRLYRSLPPFIRTSWEWWQKVDILPRTKTKIPLDSRVVRIVLPFSYASLGGLMGTLTVLFAKATIHLLTSSLFEGENQYNEVYAWVITGVTVVTAVSQIYWINMGLQRYDALLQIPVYYVVWTIFDVVGGGIYFNEFEGFNARQYGLFFLATGIIFIGVFVLGDRLKSSHV
ncbi:hypothetical protein HDU67_007866 [Dinochytrium kinnereticum]|nr:hypothetical protein HDU67_007866 [Dinochytrium kinnereticum]